MYSKKIQSQLDKKKIDTGDTITVRAKDRIYEGFLMPKPHFGNPDILVIKLSSGYNIGIIPDSIELVATTGSRFDEPSEPEKPKKGDISILGCGGTIASKVEYRTGAVYPSIKPKELRAAFPELSDWPIHSRQIFSLFSDDMNSYHWKIIADEIEEEIKAGSSGVVLMHGTDTMSYTASAISFMLQQLPVPVVFVGSQRSSDRPSSENKMNLVNAVFSASQDIGEVTVCMHADSNDELCHLHRATRVRKMHTSRRDAFRSINSDPIAKVDYRALLFQPLSDYRKRHKQLISKKKFNENVAIIYVHPNMKPDLISRLSDYDGVVLAGTGLGHVPVGAFGAKHVKGILEPIKQLIDSGIPVVMSSQCITGRLCMRVYANGRLLKDTGVIGDDADWTPEVAFTKLSWVLGQTKKMEEIKRLMETDIAGEISSKSPIGGEQ
ncbi:Glu-tRNA(Gln) amidotransferase subunit GatD [Candidatus Micrarchaeota archaeon]|nr:Glu-tRNA(Gln) amidotransferase subunit GatD [Candidatus Micrarchaeota archaeon]